MGNVDTSVAEDCLMAGLLPSQWGREFEASALQISQFCGGLGMALMQHAFDTEFVEAGDKNVVLALI